MFDKYPYRIKLQALALVLVMLFVAAYRRSFAPLLELVHENRAMTEKIEKTKGKRGDISLLQSEIDHLDNLIGKQGYSKERIQQEIVSFVAANGKSISISDLSEIHDFVEGSYKIFTYQLDVTGGFNSLSELAYSFEKKFYYCKIVSLDYRIEKKSNISEVLHLKIIFQNYENNK